MQIHLFLSILFSFFIISSTFGQTSQSFSVEGRKYVSIPFEQKTTHGHLFIGKYFGGGVIAAVTEDGQHGIIVAPFDVPTGNAVLSSDNGNPKYPSIAYSEAEKFCKDFSFQTITDWQLPDADDLALIKNNLLTNGLGEFVSTAYWHLGNSSITFNTQAQGADKNHKGARCIRLF